MRMPMLPAHLSTSDIPTLPCGDGAFDYGSRVQNPMYIDYNGMAELLDFFWESNCLIFVSTEYFGCIQMLQPHWKYLGECTDDLLLK